MTTWYQAAIQGRSARRATVSSCSAPRGTGKSTWARGQFPDAHRIDLLDEAIYQDSLLADPSLFAARLRPLKRGSWVVVDEIQRLPSLLNEVHRGIEELGLRFVLLGSSARKLKAAGTNLLAGRARWKTMFPLVPAELGADFDLSRALRFGTIALVQASDGSARRRLEAYVHLYLREEIKAEALVRNLPDSPASFPSRRSSTGSSSTSRSIARDAGTARTTVAGYLDILDDTCSRTALPAFEARLRVRERKHPKLYWVDPGLVRAVKRQLSAPSATRNAGPLLEGWVHGLLRARQAYIGLYDELAYWAPAQGGTEVDFLLRRGKTIHRDRGEVQRPARACPHGGTSRHRRSRRRSSADCWSAWPTDRSTRPTASK